jgi:hypothetical protein
MATNESIIWKIEKIVVPTPLFELVIFSITFSSDFGLGLGAPQYILLYKYIYFFLIN